MEPKALPPGNGRAGYEHGISLPALLSLPQAGLSSGHYNGLLTHRRDCDLPLLSNLEWLPTALATQPAASGRQSTPAYLSCFF